jgi:hypothetical protein
MIGRPVTSPVQAYGAGLRGWAFAIPEGTVNVIGDSSGPNERAMESLSALAVDNLSIREAYRVGRAVHFIGYVLDQENQRTKTGERVHRLLLEASRRRQAAGERYTAEELTSEFLDAFASRLSKDADWLRDRIIAYADTEVAFRYADGDLSNLRPPEAEAQRRAMAGYSHPKVEELEKHVLPLVPAFHVSGQLYDDLERSSWMTVRGGVVKTGLAFSIVVDGEHFVPLVDDPDTLARTEYLLVDARLPLWVVCERVRFRDRTSEREAAQTTGLEWNARTSERAMLVADASYEISGSVASRRDFAEREQDRMAHVALGFMAVLSHTKVAMKKIASPPERGDQFRVELPGSYTVDQIVDDINRRRHMR